jgi:hypothetical protein
MNETISEAKKRWESEPTAVTLSLTDNEYNVIIEALNRYQSSLQDELIETKSEPEDLSRVADLKSKMFSTAIGYIETKQ